MGSSMSPLGRLVMIYVAMCLAVVGSVVASLWVGPWGALPGLAAVLLCGVIESRLRCDNCGDQIVKRELRGWVLRGPLLPRTCTRCGADLSICLRQPPKT